MHFAIIAAGDGSRLSSEGAGRPKPLTDIDGRPMIGRLVDILAECDAMSISIITNARTPEVAAYLRAATASLPFSVNIIEASTRGSMESFLRLSAFLPDNSRFILTTVDTVFDPERFKSYVNEYARDPDCDGYMAVTDYIDDEKPLYISIDPATGFIDGFCDTSVTGSPYISAGIYGLGAQALDILSQCKHKGIRRMRDYQRALLNAGMRLRPYPLGTVIDVDHISDITTARSLAATARSLNGPTNG